MRFGRNTWTAGVLLCASLCLAGCAQHSIEHASEADKAAAAHAAAARQQQQDEALAAHKGITAAEAVLAQLPPPSKRRYLQVRFAEGWSNPFLIVRKKMVTLRIAGPLSGDKLPNGVLPGQKLVAVGNTKHEITLRLIDLPEALAALPEESWPYGRVVAVDEDPTTPRPDRPQMRRNVEAVMAMLNDLDVVVEEWPPSAR